MVHIILIFPVDHITNPTILPKLPSITAGWKFGLGVEAVRKPKCTVDDPAESAGFDRTIGCTDPNIEIRTMVENSD
jgi:hypothetical protein